MSYTKVTVVLLSCVIVNLVVTACSGKIPSVHLVVDMPPSLPVASSSASPQPSVVVVPVPATVVHTEAKPSGS